MMLCEDYDLVAMIEAMGVLILVLLDDALRVGIAYAGESVSSKVLILVLLDDALREEFL